MNLGVGTRVSHPAYGNGVIIRVHKAAYEVVFHTYGSQFVGKDYSKWEIIDAVEDDGIPTLSDFEKSLVKILHAFSDVQPQVKLGGKWMGGELEIRPGDPELKSKIIPIEAFFHKIVMLRERLRVLEQRINNNEKLDDEEKIQLQQYITRIYGSLTTFNVLFSDKMDYFIGEKGK